MLLAVMDAFDSSAFDAGSDPRKGTDHHDIASRGDGASATAASSDSKLGNHPFNPTADPQTLLGSIGGDAFEAKQGRTESKPRGDTQSNSGDVNFEIVSGDLVITDLSNAATELELLSDVVNQQYIVHVPNRTLVINNVDGAVVDGTTARVPFSSIDANVVFRGESEDDLATIDFELGDLANPFVMMGGESLNDELALVGGSRFNQHLIELGNPGLGSISADRQSNQHEWGRVGSEFHRLQRINDRLPRRRRRAIDALQRRQSASHRCGACLDGPVRSSRPHS